MLLPHLRKLHSTTLALLAYVLAAAVMVSVAYGAALVIESRTGKAVAARLGSRFLHMGRLPEPQHEMAVEIWGQTRAQWRAGRPSSP